MIKPRGYSNVHANYNKLRFGDCGYHTADSREDHSLVHLGTSVPLILYRGWTSNVIHEAEHAWKTTGRDEPQVKTGIGMCTLNS